MLLLLTVWNNSLLPCLRTAARICDTGLETSHVVGLHPRAVLPYQPQRVQGLPDIQGEQYPETLLMKDFSSPSSTFV